MWIPWHGKITFDSSTQFTDEFFQNIRCISAIFNSSINIIRDTVRFYKECHIYNKINMFYGVTVGASAVLPSKKLEKFISHFKHQAAQYVSTTCDVTQRHGARGSLRRQPSFWLTLNIFHDLNYLIILLFAAVSGEVVPRINRTQFLMNLQKWRCLIFF